MDPHLQRSCFFGRSFEENLEESGSFSPSGVRANALRVRASLLISVIILGLVCGFTNQTQAEGDVFMSFSSPPEDLGNLPVDGTAVCSMVDTYTPGVAFDVTILVSPPNFTIAWAVEETVPAG